MRVSQIIARTANSIFDMLGLELVPLAFQRKMSGIQIRRSADRTLRGAISLVLYNNRELKFFVGNDFDLIQSAHLDGRLYEEDELNIIKRYFRPGVFVDIGANVGNHTIFALEVLGAKGAIVFEPNPKASEILFVNAALNNCISKIELHMVGLSDNEAKVSVSHPRYNLGGGRLEVSPNGNLTVKVGDEILKNAEDISFIKIDTEGYELNVLRGLKNTIGVHKPAIFIEVDSENDIEAKKVMAELGYEVVEKFQRYKTSTNYMFLPFEGDVKHGGQTA